MRSDDAINQDEMGRRTLLKRAGVLGLATAWTVPVLQSTGVAQAVGSPAPGGPAPVTYPRLLASEKILSAGTHVVHFAAYSGSATYASGTTSIPMVFDRRRYSVYLSPEPGAQLKLPGVLLLPYADSPGSGRIEVGYYSQGIDVTPGWRGAFSGNNYYSLYATRSYMDVNEKDVEIVTSDAYFNYYDNGPY